MRAKVIRELIDEIRALPAELADAGSSAPSNTPRNAGDR